MAVVSLMATLPCGQTDITQMAVKALQSMNFSQSTRRKPPEEFNMNRDDRQDVYSTFEQLGDPGVTIVGASHVLLVGQDWVSSYFC